MTYIGRRNTVYSNVLVPTDGSEEANKAVDQAIDLASECDAAVHALYVHGPPRTTLPSEAMRHEETREEYLEWGEEITAEVADRAEERGLRGVSVVVEGVPHEEINRYATENDIDIVVMGTAGRTGLRDRLLGSVTEKTSRTSDIPVLIARAEDSP